ncbi:MAG: VOC family protein, partial [Gemmatimonadales bacterium]
PARRVSRMPIRFTYSGIEVRDMERSLKFYADVMGMRLLDRHPIPETGGEVATLQSEGAQQYLELNHYPHRREKYVPGDGLDHLAFEVDDVAAELKRLNALGFRTMRPLEQRAKFIVGFAEDPDGLWIELYTPRR